MLVYREIREMMFRLEMFGCLRDDGLVDEARHINAFASTPAT